MSKANSHLLPWSSRRSERSFSSSPEGRGFFLRGHTSVLFCTQGTNPNWEGEGEGEGKSARALLTPFLLLLPLLIPAPKEEIELTSDFYSILSVHFQREDEVGGWVVVRGGGKRTRREGKGREGERELTSCLSCLVTSSIPKFNLANATEISPFASRSTPDALLPVPNDGRGGCLEDEPGTREEEEAAGT